jgi:hypothetical protein
VGYAILHLMDSDTKGRPLEPQDVKRRLRDFSPILEVLSQVEDEVLLEQELRRNPRERLQARAMRHSVSNLAPQIHNLRDIDSRVRLVKRQSRLALASTLASEPGAFEFTMPIQELVSKLVDLSDDKFRVDVQNPPADKRQCAVKPALLGVLAEFITNADKRDIKRVSVQLDFSVGFLSVAVSNPVSVPVHAEIQAQLDRMNDPNEPEPGGGQPYGIFYVKHLVRLMDGSCRFELADKEFCARVQVPLRGEE